MPRVGYQVYGSVPHRLVFVEDEEEKPTTRMGIMRIERMFLTSSRKYVVREVVKMGAGEGG